jgi:type IV secretory pathway VirB3-like protein
VGPVAEQPEKEVLFVAATRPAIMPILGLPHGLAIIFVCAFMEVIIWTQNFLDELILLPFWGAAFLYVRHDYNAMRILGLWFQSKSKSLLDFWRWGGASLSPWPIRERLPRGIDAR